MQNNPLNETVAPPDASNALRPATRPVATKKTAPGPAKAPIRKISASSKKPMPMPVVDPAVKTALVPEATKKASPRPAKAQIKKVEAGGNQPIPMRIVKPTVKKALATTSQPAPSKLLKPKKIKLVRDSFAIPKLEYLMLESLKLRADALGHSVKKSELIRAGIKAIAAMPDSQFLAAVNALAPTKIRPPSNN